MKTIQTYFVGTLLVIAILFLSCQHHPTQPENGDIIFNFKFAFAENESRTMNKISTSEIVNMGHVMVIDLSAYEDMQDFRNSDKYIDFLTARQQIREDSSTNWSEWVSAYNESFSIVTDKDFTIEGDTAYVTATGVSGLNYIFIALDDDNQIRYWAEDHTHGEEDTQEPVYIWLYEWEYYEPAEEPQEESLFEVVATIPVGENPDIPALSLDDAYLYVANQLDSSISVISTASNSVITTLTSGWWPRQPIAVPDGNSIYVPVENRSRIDVISTTSNTISDAIRLGDYIDERVKHIAFSTDGETAFTISEDNKGSFIQVNNREVLNTITYGSSQRGVVAGPNNNFFFVADYLEDQIHVIAAQNQVLHQSIDVGISPHEPAITPDGTKLYVSNEYSDNIAIIDINSLTVENYISAGNGPKRGMFTSDGTYFIVPNFSSSSVSIIEKATGSTLAEITVGQDPYEGTMSADNQYAYIPCWSGNVISVISIENRSLLENIETGESPQKPVITEDGTIYTTNYNSNSVTVIRKKNQ